jgi:hypothetical protein
MKVEMGAKGHICVCMCIYIYTHTHTYINTYTRMIGKRNACRILMERPEGRCLHYWFRLDECIILKLILDKQKIWIWTWFIWLGISSCSRLWAQWQNIAFRRIRRTSRSGDDCHLLWKGYDPWSYASYWCLSLLYDVPWGTFWYYTTATICPSPVELWLYSFLT